MEGDHGTVEDVSYALKEPQARQSDHQPIEQQDEEQHIVALVEQDLARTPELPDADAELIKQGQGVVQEGEAIVADQGNVEHADTQMQDVGDLQPFDPQLAVQPESTTPEGPYLPEDTLQPSEQVPTLHSGDSTAEQPSSPSPEDLLKQIPQPTRKRKKKALVDDGRHLFACETCGERFTRHENLTRHRRNHDRSDKERCTMCEVTCIRPDLMKRHVRKFHPAEFPSLYPPKPKKVRQPGAKEESSATLDTGNPIAAAYDGSQTYGNSDAANVLTSLANVDPQLHEVSGDGGLLLNAGYLPGLASQDRVLLGGLVSEELQNFVDLYFRHFHPAFPILHEATFRKSLANTFLAGPVACIGMLYANDSSLRDRATAIWWDLIQILRASGESDEVDFGAIQVSQAWILLNYYGLFLGDDKTHSQALEHQTVRINQLRKVGMTMAGISDPDTKAGTEHQWHDFVQHESRKRTMFGIYLLDCQVSMVFTSANALTPMEVRHAMPCSDEAWAAQSADAWRAAQDRAGSGERRHDHHGELFFKDHLAGLLQRQTISSKLDALSALTLVYSILVMIRNATHDESLCHDAAGIAVFGVHSPPAGRRQVINAALDTLANAASSLPKAPAMAFQAALSAARLNLIVIDPLVLYGMVEISMELTVASMIAIYGDGFLPGADSSAIHGHTAMLEGNENARRQAVLAAVPQFLLALPHLRGCIEAVGISASRGALKHDPSALASSQRGDDDDSMAAGVAVHQQQPRPRTEDPATSVMLLRGLLTAWRILEALDSLPPDARPAGIDDAVKDALHLDDVFRAVDQHNTDASASSIADAGHMHAAAAGGMVQNDTVIDHLSTTPPPPAQDVAPHPAVAVDVTSTAAGAEAPAGASRATLFGRYIAHRAFLGCDAWRLEEFAQKYASGGQLER